MELNGQNSSPLLATAQARDKFIRYPWKRSLRMRLFNNRRFRRILYGTLIFVILLFTLVFIVVPFVFRYSYTLQRSFLFLNFVNNASNIEVPTKHGLVGARNLYVESEDGVRLGTWHILPSSKLPELLVQGLLTTSSIDDIYDNHLRSGDPIIIYLHGNAGNRAASHRLGIYKVLQRNNYHVIAFDYRSYGDSSPVSPNEQGVVNDAKAIYAWVKRIAPKSNVFIWGHSLGTGVASHCIYELEGEGKKTTGVVLEAPFTNLQDELRDYPMTGLFQRLPWFDFFFVDPMYDNNFRFASDLYLMNVTAPVLILHAEDDVVVPLHLGRRLYEKIKENRGPGKEDTIKFIDFPKNRHLGHQDIYRDSSLPQIVSNFVTTNLKKQ